MSHDIYKDVPLSSPLKSVVGTFYIMSCQKDKLTSGTVNTDLYNVGNLYLPEHHNIECYALSL